MTIKRTLTGLITAAVMALPQPSYAREMVPCDVVTYTWDSESFGDPVTTLMINGDNQFYRVSGFLAALSGNPTLSTEEKSMIWKRSQTASPGAHYLTVEDKVRDYFRWVHTPQLAATSLTRKEIPKTKIIQHTPQLAVVGFLIVGRLLKQLLNSREI